MPQRSDLFYNNRVYKLLNKSELDSNGVLQELNSILHEEPDLVECTHPNEGTFFHLICRKSRRNDKFLFRMIYALSNAGGDPNVSDGQGNTPLHEALIHEHTRWNYDLIQALFRIGIDQRLINNDGKTADAYIDDNPQLQTLYKAYGDGIWSAIESNNIIETERLIKGFIKIDCKHNSNKTLLDKIRDLNSTSMIHLVAEYQVTNEFLHSILAFDWQRTSIIYQYEREFLKINSFDTIHRLTFIRTYSKSLIEYCFDCQTIEPWKILFTYPIDSLNVNILFTDGQPFYFHCLNSILFTNEMQKKIIDRSNLFKKSSIGETFIFLLIKKYIENTDEIYLTLFTNILSEYPLIISLRNEFEQTIIELIYFQQTKENFDKLQRFIQIIKTILIKQLKDNSTIEKYIFNYFGYFLLFFFKNQTLPMTKYIYSLLNSLKINQGLPNSIQLLKQTIIENDFTKFKSLFPYKSNIHCAKDSFGRTCAHLAILYRRYEFFEFLCENFPKILYLKDNLRRTPCHYACIMNEKKFIEIIQQTNLIRSIQTFDCLNLRPNDYLINRDLCSELYSAEDFSINELQRSSVSISNYLKIAFYPNLKQAIEKDSIDDMKICLNEIRRMGFQLKDLTTNSYLNDYIQGERYIPLLFLAIQHRSLASIKCLIEYGIPLIGQFYLAKSKINEYSHWIKYRSETDQDFECIELEDLIEELKLNDDIEMKIAFQTNQISIPIEDTKSTQSENLTIKQQFRNNFFRINRTNSQMCIIS